MKNPIISFLSIGTFVFSFGFSVVSAEVAPLQRVTAVRALGVSATTTKASSTQTGIGVAKSLKGGVEKKAYQQFYGTVVQQSRSSIPKAQAIALCNARVSSIKERSSKKLKEYSDMSKVKCMWGTEQIYPAVVSKAVKKGTPQVLGASTSNVPCFDAPRAMHRGNELRIGRRVQAFLVQKGFLNEADVSMDGVYGDKVTQAVKAYQASVNLPTTGDIYDIANEVMPMGGCR